MRGFINLGSAICTVSFPWKPNIKLISFPATSIKTTIHTNGFEYYFVDEEFVVDREFGLAPE
jgi:hypothetical protein